MELIKYFGQNILDVLTSLREKEHIVDYGKVERDEFLQLPECGYYFQAKNGVGKISDIRIFLEQHDGFFPSKSELRGKYDNVKNFADMNNLLGQPLKEIRSMKIPGTPPTLPGKQYSDGDFIVSAFSEDGENITFIHIKTQLDC